jgi:hypothetical protein
MAICLGPEQGVEHLVSHHLPVHLLAPRHHDAIADGRPVSVNAFA